MKPWLLRIVSAAEAKLEIAIYDVLGKNIFGEGVGSEDVLRSLNSKPKASVLVRVNSIGGFLDEAKAMLNLLAERAASGAEVEFRVDSIAASAAAYLLTTPGATVTMAENAFVMIHKARKLAIGTDSAMEAAANELRAANEIMAEAFAGASSSRKKKRSKEQWLAEMAKGDRYFRAEEAIQWGLADSVVESSKVAACAVDVSGFEEPPEDLVRAPYAFRPAAVMGDLLISRGTITVPEGTDPATLTAAIQTILPGTPGQEPTNPPAPPSGPTEIIPMTFPKNLTLALALAEDAEEAAVVAAIGKLKTSARVGSAIEALLTVQGDAAIGAVRALKETSANNAVLAVEVDKLKVSNARRDFEGSRDQGLKEKKLTPATARLYTDRFEAAAKLDDEGKPTGDCDAVAADLRGFLAVAPRLAAASVREAHVEGANVGATQHNGKKFEEMKGGERASLKRDNPDLYTTLREDAMARGAL